MPESYAPIRELLDGVASVTRRQEAPQMPRLRGERQALLSLGGRPEAPLENRSGARSDQQLVNLWLSSKRSHHTRRAYARDTDAFSCFLGALPPREDEEDMPGRPWSLAQVTVRHLQAFVEHLEGDGSAPRTVARRLSAVKSLMSFAQQTGYLQYNVGAVVKLPAFARDLAQRILSEDEVNRCFRAAPFGRNRTLLRFLYFSGCRVSEAAGLQWEHLSEREDRLLVTLYGKGSKTRVVPLPRHLKHELEELQRANMSGHVFESRGGKPLDSKTMWRITSSAAEGADISRRVSPHFMRHSHASHAVRRGAKVHVVQQTLGHASVQTTGDYLHIELGESSAFYLDGAPKS